MFCLKFGTFFDFLIKESICVKSSFNEIKRLLISMKRIRRNSPSTWFSYNCCGRFWSPNKFCTSWVSKSIIPATIYHSFISISNPKRVRNKQVLLSQKCDPDEWQLRNLFIKFLKILIISPDLQINLQTDGQSKI